MICTTAITICESPIPPSNSTDETPLNRRRRMVRVRISRPRSSAVWGMSRRMAKTNRPGV